MVIDPVSPGWRKQLYVVLAGIKIPSLLCPVCKICPLRLIWWFCASVLCQCTISKAGMTKFPGLNAALAPAGTISDFRHASAPE